MADIHRMIEGRTVALDDAHPPFCFLTRVEENGLEEVCVHVVGAGAGEEEAPGRKVCECQAVQSLVAADRAFHAAASLCESGGIENDEAVGTGERVTAQEFESVLCIA